MISIMSTAASAMKGASRMLDASAHNTANLRTRDFKGLRVSFSENPEGGVTTKVERTTTPGPTVVDPRGNSFSLSNVNLAEEVVNQISAVHYMKANVNVAKTADEMQKSVIDIFA